MTSCQFVISQLVVVALAVGGWWVLWRQNQQDIKDRRKLEMRMGHASEAIVRLGRIMSAASEFNMWAGRVRWDLDLEKRLREVSGLQEAPHKKSVWKQPEGPPHVQAYEMASELSDAVTSFGYYFEASEIVLSEFSGAKKTLLKYANELWEPLREVSTYLAVLLYYKFYRVGALDRIDPDEVHEHLTEIRDSSMDFLVYAYDLIREMQNEVYGEVFEYRIPRREPLEGAVMTRDGIERPASQ